MSEPKNKKNPPVVSIYPQHVPVYYTIKILGQDKGKRKVKVSCLPS